MPTEPTPDQLKRMNNCKRCQGVRYVLGTIREKDCLLCNGTGQVYAGDHTIGDGKTEPFYAACNACLTQIAEDCPDCLKLVKYEIRLADSGIPPRFQTLEFSDYVYPESVTYKNVWKFINQIDKAMEKHLCLLLYGTKNTGKSLLASCILKELMKRNYSCSFVPFTSVFESDDVVTARLSEDNQICCVDDVTDVLNSLVNFTVSPLTDEKTNGAITRLKEIVTDRARQNCITILTGLVPISVFEANPTFKGLGSVLRGNFEEIHCVDGDFIKRTSEQRKGEFGFDQV